MTWEHTRRPPSHRKCKYTVSLLMRLFSVPLLAHSVASDTLRDFVSAMLLTLIDGRVLEIQEGGNLMKACPSDDSDALLTISMLAFIPPFWHDSFFSMRWMMWQRQDAADGQGLRTPVARC